MLYELIFFGGLLLSLHFLDKLTSKNCIITQEKKERVYILKEELEVRGTYSIEVNGKNFSFHTDSLEFLEKTDMYYMYRFKQDYIGIFIKNLQARHITKKEIAEDYKTTSNLTMLRTFGLAACRESRKIIKEKM